MAETAIQFLERWRQAHVYAELRALEQLDETVAECIGAAAEDGISTDDIEKAAGGSLKEYLARRNYLYERIMPRGSQGREAARSGSSTCKALRRRPRLLCGVPPEYDRAADA